MNIRLPMVSGIYAEQGTATYLQTGIHDGRILCWIGPLAIGTFPRRERLPCTGRSSGITNFNPRSRVGSDLTELQKYINKQPFQSTLPRRERHEGSININAI